MHVFLHFRVVKIRPALENDKEAVLLALCTRTFKEKVIIFRFVAPFDYPESAQFVFGYFCGYRHAVLSLQLISTHLGDKFY